MGKSEIELTSEGEPDRKITIQGWDIKDAELAKLLEETAKFLREPGSTSAGDGAELTFKPVDTGELFIISHRS